MKRLYLGLHLILMFYAIGGIFSKLAAQESFLSKDYIINYLIVLAILAIYALIWQKLLKKLPLTVAMANKSVTVIWGMIFGYFIFHEQISFFNILGAGIIIIGIIIVVRGDKEKTTCI